MQHKPNSRTKFPPAKLDHRALFVRETEYRIFGERNIFHL